MNIMDQDGVQMKDKTFKFRNKDANTCTVEN